VQYVKSYGKKSTMETVGWVKQTAERFRIEPEEIFVDDTGLGGGVTDRLEELGIYVNAVNNGETALERDRFRNVRTESYWNVRERLQPDSPNPFYCPKEFSGAIKECAWAHYKLTSTGQLALESKDLIKARRGRSPDEGDALALTFCGGSGFSIAG